MGGFEPALVAYLRAEVAVVGGRVHPGVLPDPPTLPALVYQRISTQRPVVHDGRLGFVESRFQIDAWAASYGAARGVASAVTRALLGYRGQMGGVSVAIPRQTADLDMSEPENGLYRVMTEFVIWHSEED